VSNFYININKRSDLNRTFRMQEFLQQIGLGILSVYQRDTLKMSNPVARINTTCYPSEPQRHIKNVVAQHFANIRHCQQAFAMVIRMKEALKVSVPVEPFDALYGL